MKIKVQHEGKECFINIPAKYKDKFLLVFPAEASSETKEKEVHK